MPLITIRDFSGEVPRIAAKDLQPNQAQRAIKCKLYSREVRPWNKPVEIMNLGASTDPIKTIYKFQTFWIYWTEDVDVVSGPVADTKERTYFTGTDYPRVFNSDMLFSSLAGGSLTSYRTGVPTPTTKPTVVKETRTKIVPETSQGAIGMGDGLHGFSMHALAMGAGLTPVDDPGTEIRSIAYVTTFVNAWGEEGAPSPPSDVIDVSATYYVDLSDLEAAPAGDWNLTARRIYRVNTGSTSAAYQFVDEIDILDTTYHDTVLDEDLGEVLSTEGYVPPPDDMVGIVRLPNGGMAGFSGKDLCFCVPYLCYAWPISYRLTFNYPIVGLGVFGTTIVVTTTFCTYLVTGASPESMAVDDSALPYPCVSKRGIVSDNSGVLFPTHDGLMYVGPGGAKTITDELFRKTEWSKVEPETLHAELYGGSYLGFHLIDESAEWARIMEETFQDNLIAYYEDDDLRGHIGGAYVGRYAIGCSAIKPIYTDLNLDAGEGMAIGSGVAEGTLTRIDYAYASFLDQATGNLYLVVKENDEYKIVQFDGNAEEQDIYTWKSKRYELPALMNFGAAKVKADYDLDNTPERREAYSAYRAAVIEANEAMIAAGDAGGSINDDDINLLDINASRLMEVPPEVMPPPTVLFRLIGDGEVKYEKIATSPEPFRLPSGYKARRFEVEIQTDISLEEVRLATSIVELATGDA